VSKLEQVPVCVYPALSTSQLVTTLWSLPMPTGQIPIEGSAVFLKGYMDSLCMRTDQGGAERGKHTWDPGTTISEVRSMKEVGYLLRWGC
jgi:hypothetical protein